MNLAITAGRATAIALPFLLVSSFGDVNNQLAARPAIVEVRFDRAAVARQLVQLHRGAIREVTTPFPGSTLFEPAGRSKGAGILLLHGSEGGSQPYSMWEAAELAAHGYTVLACSYFDVPGSNLPKHLLEVPLECVQNAADWLHARCGKVVLKGVSRGGELALQLASLDPHRERFAAVIAEVPSNQIWGAWNHQKLQPINDAHGRIRSAWTLGGQPLEEGQPIEIERYGGPIFLTGAGRDDVWPSADYVKQIERRLEQHGKKAEVHIFPRERHILSESAHARSSTMIRDFIERGLREG